jgi:hypothetical protein
MRDFAVQSYEARVNRQRKWKPIPELREEDMPDLGEMGEERVTLSQGWALHQPRQRKAIPKPVVEFLDGKFWDGERTKLKVDPGQMEKEIRNLFPPEQWVREATVASYFSRKAAKERQNRQAEEGEVAAEQETEEEITEEVHEEAPEMELEVEEIAQLDEDHLQYQVQQLITTESNT